ncbi:response regulator [Amphibacillus cookii]|uniref:response regulator n=1 Tax=Amphibacillus cookii TaxID=767787 RepID=UPI00195CC6EC|nr:response regulator [Amphibacillus cookii]MBM7540838.1 DNA-binding response OmpR family regulator [Amphibacillus cookii]
MDKSVLIVDDQKGIRFLLEEVIRSEGYRVSSCQDGQSAIKSIENQPPDLLIIDYRLPMMNGGKVIAHLEAQGYQIPTIVMSGLVDEIKPKIEGFNSVKGYFSKPFNILEAKNQVNQLLQD